MPRSRLFARVGDAVARSSQLETMDADREFLHRANIGGEFMSDADIERVRRIGSGYQWRRPDGTTGNFSVMTNSRI
jgi:hypothetical protein